MDCYAFCFRARLMNVASYVTEGATQHKELLGQRVLMLFDGFLSTAGEVTFRKRVGAVRCRKRFCVVRMLSQRSIFNGRVGSLKSRRLSNNH